jgi:maleate cis-trans isomerase
MRQYFEQLESMSIALNEFGHAPVMYGWRARIGNISPTACSEILPYEFYRVAPEGVTFVSTNLVIRDARESSQVEASWGKFDTAFEDVLHTRVDHITLSGAPLVLASGVERHRELLREFRNRYPVPVGTSPQSFAGALKYLGAVKLAVVTSFIPAHNETNW